MSTKKKNPHAVALGRHDGSKGGQARAVATAQRSESARKASEARWAKRRRDRGLE